jgi:hypothetical protein
VELALGVAAGMEVRVAGEGEAWEAARTVGVFAGTGAGDWKSGRLT